MYDGGRRLSFGFSALARRAAALAARSLFAVGALPEAAARRSAATAALEAAACMASTGFTFRGSATLQAWFAKKKKSLVCERKYSLCVALELSNRLPHAAVDYAVDYAGLGGLGRLQTSLCRNQKQG